MASTVPTAPQQTHCKHASKKHAPIDIDAGDGRVAQLNPLGLHRNAFTVKLNSNSHTDVFLRKPPTNRHEDGVDIPIRGASEEGRCGMC